MVKGEGQPVGAFPASRLRRLLGRMVSGLSGKAAQSGTRRPCEGRDTRTRRDNGLPDEEPLSEWESVDSEWPMP